MRYVLLVALLACSKGPDPVPAPPAPQQPSPDPAPAHARPDAATAAPATPQGALANIASIVMSQDTACAIDRDHHVACWGSNVDGGLGIGEPPRTCANEVCPVAIDVKVDPVTTVGLGMHFGCALLVSGMISCWGDGSWGQLAGAVPPDKCGRKSPTGIGDLFHACARAPIAGGLGETIALAVGQHHTCFANVGGDVYCTGSAAPAGATKPETCHVTEVESEDCAMRPVKVAGVKAIALAASATTTCALDPGGTVSCWGIGTSGELGDGGPPRTSVKPVKVAGVSDAVQLVGYDAGFCARRRTGADVCWGHVPSSANACVLLADGTVRCTAGILHGGGDVVMRSP